jgi:hypothetical protein
MSKKYIWSKTGETSFEHEFLYACRHLNTEYIKIKDARIDGLRYNKIKEGNFKGYRKAGFEDEVRRPYDGTIIGRLGNFPVEFKYNNNGLEEHQKKNQGKIDSINNSFFVIRKSVWCDEVNHDTGVISKWITRYSIEKRIDNRLKKIYLTDDMVNIIKWFNGETGDEENNIRKYVSWLR